MIRVFCDGQMQLNVTCNNIIFVTSQQVRRSPPLLGVTVYVLYRVRVAGRYRFHRETNGKTK